MTGQSDGLWQCPGCGRSFAKKNQWHSCDARTMEEHFHDKDPRLRQIFDLLLSRLRQLGPIRVDAVKSSINLIYEHHFGGMAVKKDRLRLGFLTDEVIGDPRIVKTERLWPGKTGYQVELRSPDDVDDQLLGG